LVIGAARGEFDGRDPVGARDRRNLFDFQRSQLPTVGYVMAKGGVTLNDVAYTRPRQSTCVFYSPATACTTL